VDHRLTGSIRRANGGVLFTKERGIEAGSQLNKWSDQPLTEETYADAACQNDYGEPTRWQKGQNIKLKLRGIRSEKSAGEGSDSLYSGSC
jgi:hypothetical protein